MYSHFADSETIFDPSPHIIYIQYPPNPLAYFDPFSCCVSRSIPRSLSHQHHRRDSERERESLNAMMGSLSYTVAVSGLLAKLDLASQQRILRVDLGTTLSLTVRRAVLVAKAGII